MKILIIRHGDPDYAIDGLTEKGKREAELLANRLEKENIKAVYCSVFGRAKLTAKPFLDKMNLKAEYCEWLREYEYATIHDPYGGGERYAWDLMPEYVNSLENVFDRDGWRAENIIKGSKMPIEYDNVCREFDKVLSKHGYRRDGYNYVAENPNHDTIVIVCHYGLTAVLLSHIMNCSPYSIWQHAFTAPTAITTIYTEERQKGVAQLRVSAIGDVSHLYVADEEPSFSGRFCECNDDETRH